MVTYLLAIASPTHSVPASMYYSGWANQDSTGIKYRSGWGQTIDGSMYTNGKTYFGVKLDVGVSNGGPLFFTHYSYMGYDPHFITDKYTNYFINNQNIAKINYRYCVQNPKRFKGYGEDAWGLTASDGPFNYSADEPVAWQDHGKITPTGAISSFPYTPVESMKALKNYYYNYGKFLWGEYGFRDAFDLTNNWCSDIYMGLNQAPMTVMIENLSYWSNMETVHAKSGNTKRAKKNKQSIITYKTCHMNNNISRQQFLQYTAAAGAAVLLSSLESLALETPQKKLRIALIGCGSVSNRYIPHLQTSSLIEIVSLCDIKYERAVAQNKQYNVNAQTYPHIDAMLEGVPFDMMVTTTDMQEHGHLNKKALLAGKHVWSEKPMANTYAEGKALYDLAKSKKVKNMGSTCCCQ